MQKGSTTKGFAEAYGIPLELFQSWLSERKYDKRNKKRKVERRKNVSKALLFKVGYRRRKDDDKTTMGWLAGWLAG